MNLEAYLRRIRYEGERAPTLPTLTALHEAHLTNIAYENLDIHLGRYVGLDLDAIYDKIVERGRGGWCFEMNGLFAWALRELGYDVTMLGSAVDRETQGESHLILLVKLYQPYLVDVGFANGLFRPIPLAEGRYQQRSLEYRLAKQGEQWFFTNHIYGGAGFDFSLQPRTLASFGERCHVLQTSPESGFVRNAVCFRFTPQGYIGIRGAILKTIAGADIAEQTITDEASYSRLLRDQFLLRLNDDEIAHLWQRVWARHQEFLASQM